MAPRRPKAPAGATVAVGPAMPLSEVHESFVEAEEALAAATAFGITGTVDLTAVGPLTLVTVADRVAARLADRYFGDLGEGFSEVEDTVRTLLDQEVERARRAERQLALVMIDIDDFKRFNDTYGHQAGDEVLRHVAQMVARVLRRADAVARYGGEEFVVLLADAATPETLQVAEKIRAEVEKTALTLAGLLRPLHVTISLGVASFPADAINGPDLVAAADRGLYQAKRSGKNRVCHAAPGATPE